MAFDSSQGAYVQLRKIYAERVKETVLWTGAGLSVDAELPTWSGLRHRLESEAGNKIATYDERDREKKRKDLILIKQMRDPWMAFQRLRSFLGQATYQTLIRTILNPGDTCTIPELYLTIWRMHFGGVLNLNLDGLVARAFSAVHGSKRVHTTTGFDVGTHAHILKSSAPFIVNLHGTLDNASSWVFALDELKTLLQRPPYLSFINTILTSRTVLFVGVSADDVASGGVLAKLREEGTDPGPHFWITNRTDANTDKWAEKNGIQIIRYGSGLSSHVELKEFFADLARYIPEDTPLPLPVRPTLDPQAEWSESAAELATQAPETIRVKLNSRAAQILSAGDDHAISKYNDFCAEYGRAIHYAWFVSDHPPDNFLFGYRVTKKLGEGAFGTVFQAESNSGQRVAIKLLRHEVRSNMAMLASFRRGVRSMKILSDNSVDGMVPYRRAYELPPCAVMDLVEGFNLEQAVQTKMLSDWGDQLRIAREMVQIIRAGHCLPQSVLHRDIRPANIMLRNTGGKISEWPVVILDFDLSWHKDAAERSIDLMGGRALAYAAPEQTATTPGASTRNALVDSFGLGMTLHYLFTQADPKLGDYKNPEWFRAVEELLLARPQATWISTPSRIARLISRCTCPEQAGRLDVGQIGAELERLDEANRDRSQVTSSELWVEELLCHAYGPGKYSWDLDHLRGAGPHMGGLEVLVSANEVKRRVECKIIWASSGHEGKKSLEKYVSRACDRAKQIAEEHGWRPFSSKESASAAVEFHIDVSRLMKSQAGSDFGLSKAVDCFHSLS